MLSAGRWLAAGMMSWLATSPVQGQAERYELGQRLRAFEQAWEIHQEARARKNAVGPLLKATTAFFSFRLGEAGRQLDLARFAVQDLDPVDPDRRWAESLYATVSPRLLDGSVKEISVAVRPFYVEKIQPPQARVRLFLLANQNLLALGERDFSDLPCTVSLPLADLPPGDHQIGVEIFVQGRRLATWRHSVSFAADLDARLKRLKEQSAALPDQPANTDRATLKHLTDLLHQLAQPRMLETNYPGARLLADAEALLAALQRQHPYYTWERSGQHWLRLAGKTGQAVVRVQVPPLKNKAARLPLVLALHGAGGSENMFFDGYGDGLIARLCAQRGWLLAAPRSGLLPLGNDLGLVIDALSERYPVDRRRVFVVGHSMGAGQALQAAQRMPERLAGVAALGGGSRARVNDPMKNLPFFIGVGDRDFALAGARQLRDSLKQGGAARVEFHEYPDIEHLVIVQHSLRDVLKFFDALTMGQ